MTGDWLPLAQRVLCCEWADDDWCETHDDPWPCGRAQEAADVLAEELDQPTKEQKMSKTTTGDEGGIVRCECGRAVPCRHCPTTPTPIDPADIRPGDVVEFRRRVNVTRVDPDGWIFENSQGFATDSVLSTWHLVSRPDPDAEAVEALERAALPKDDNSPSGFQGWWNILAALREQGWDVVRRAEPVGQQALADWLEMVGAWIDEGLGLIPPDINIGDAWADIERQAHSLADIILGAES